ncbi:MAG: glycosyltransferase family 9 protein [Elusimicrobiota bacterium]|jgi:ADP-heptose:LPS heptosyltransferase|nr:glycosyltransferase family 9 protein [Elusimicrobiota bacterium]
MQPLNVISRNLRTALAKKLLDKKERNTAVAVLKTDLQNQPVLDVSRFSSILFVIHDDRIGDMVISTIPFREIKKKYPNLKIFVLCGKNGKEVLKYNLNVDRVFEFYGKLSKDLKVYKELHKQKVGIIADFFEFNPRFLHLLSLRIINPSFLIGFFKKNYNTYDLSIDKDFFACHIVERHKALLKVLGIDEIDLSYDIFFGPQEQAKAQQYIDKSPSKTKIAINPFASSKHRTFDKEKLKDLAWQIRQKKDCSVYILCPPSKYEFLKGIENEGEGIFLVCLSSILCVAAFIKQCDIVISPDTSIVHIASAFKKKTIALYLDFSNRKEKTDIIWGPNNPNAVLINVDTQGGKVLNDINNIGNEEILKKLEGMK